MSQEEYELHKDWEGTYGRMLAINPKELMEKHRHPMKVAYVVGMLRLFYVLKERYHNPTWYEVEQFGERLEGQAQAFFEDIEQQNEINAVMQEVNREPVDPEREKLLKDLKEINAANERKKLLKFPMRMAMITRSLLIMYIPITHWRHPELVGWQVLAESWPVLIPVAFIFYFEWKMEQIIKPKFKK